MDNIDNFDIRMHIIESIVETFDSMVSAKLEPTDTIPPESLEYLSNAVSVSFTGDATGMVSIHIDDHFTRQLAAKMLEMEVNELEGDEEIKNMMGELGNVVKGNLKNAFTDAGLACTFSTPADTTGTDFKVESLNTEEQERFTFRSGDNLVSVEIGLNISKPVQVSGRQAQDIHYKARQDEAKETSSEADLAAKSQEAAAAEPPIGDRQQPEPVSRPAAAQSPDKVSQPQPTQPAQPQRPEDFDLDLLLDIPLELKVELGRARIQIQELLNLRPGSAVKLVRLEGEPVDILANDTLIARGEVVVQNEKYGIRITEITSRMDRIRSFSI
jgi:flagellar motor switch protein FliN